MKIEKRKEKERENKGETLKATSLSLSVYLNTLSKIKKKIESGRNCRY